MSQLNNAALDSALTFYRQKRNFDAEKHRINKVAAIKSFLNKNQINSVVIGLSGGIDSAVVFKLFEEAFRSLYLGNGGADWKLVGLILPISTDGVTGQKEAEERALLLKENLGERCIIQKCNLSGAQACYESVNPFGNTTSTAWSNGQLASIVRTPILYYTAALLQDQGYNSIVSGTTNRDEGAYLGFYGKASDGMNDIQPIGDLHKSEVYKLAELLEVPQAIIDEKPRGDVWDNRTDEEMIGAPYDAIELFLLEKEFNDVSVFKLIDYHRRLNPVPTGQQDPTYFADEMWSKFVKNIETLHKKNEHKYQVGMPAHFIDVETRTIPGGWQ